MLQGKAETSPECTTGKTADRAAEYKLGRRTVAMELLHLGEFIFPICEVRAEVPGKLRVHHFHGTGFGIGDEGFFLSAQHVIDQADVASGALLAALLKVSKGTEWQPARIFQVERCPGKDVCMFPGRDGVVRAMKERRLWDQKE
jgi:hypothetical protein